MHGKKGLRFGDVWHPNSQRSLRRLKGKPAQERWIVGAFGDSEFVLSAHEWDGGLSRQLWQVGPAPYKDLWRALANARLGGGNKVWLIGWRVRYALERANFLLALERGEVKLPVKKSGENAGKHTGKLT